MLKVKNRAGEAGHTPVRSDRFFSAQGAWYFSTREGAPIGPFREKNEAKNGLRDFIEFVTLAEPQIVSRLQATLRA